MDLTYALVVAVFGMCAAVVAARPTAAAPTPPPEQPWPQRVAGEPADNGKRSRSLFRSPPPPHQFQQLQQGGVDDIGLQYDEVVMMDDRLAPLYDDRQQDVDGPNAVADVDDDGADPRTAGRARPGNKPDSPVYFIRLPPQPYVYVPGFGYVSQPTRLEPPPFAQRPHSPFLDLPLGYVSNAKPVGVYTLPPQQQQQHQFQYQQQQQQFSGRPKPPPKRPLQQATTTPPPPPPPQRPDSSVYNLDKGPYVFNGRPSDAYLLQSAYDSLYSEVLQNIYP